jgi:hypothetical protein
MVTGRRSANIGDMLHRHLADAVVVGRTERRGLRHRRGRGGVKKAWRNSGSCSRRSASVVLASVCMNRSNSGGTFCPPNSRLATPSPEPPPSSRWVGLVRDDRHDDRRRRVFLRADQDEGHCGGLAQDQRHENEQPGALKIHRTVPAEGSAQPTHEMAVGPELFAETAQRKVPQRRRISITTRRRSGRHPTGIGILRRRPDIAHARTMSIWPDQNFTWKQEPRSIQ